MYMLVKQVPKLLKEGDQYIENQAAEREIEMLKVLQRKVTLNNLQLEYQGKQVCNPILKILDGTDDWWLVYDYNYVPPRSLKRGVQIERIIDNDRLYYQNLEDALWEVSEETHRGSKFQVYEHGLFYKGYRAQDKNNKKMI